MNKANLEVCCDPINTIVFLTLQSVTAIEEEKWGFGYLRSQGFEVAVLDLTHLLNKRQNNCSLLLQPAQGDFIHHIKTYQEFEYFVKKFSRNSLFIDYLVGVSFITFKTERIFRILRQNNARYTFLTAGALPLVSSLATNMSGKIKIFISKSVKAITKPYKFFNYLASKVIMLLARHSVIYPLPTVVFGGNSEILQRYVKALKFDKKKIVPINSFDYDFSILLLRSLGNKMPESERMCVFLDEAATHHSDFALLGIEPATESYFASMNRFFGFVENITGLKVVIAAHPRSHYESMPDVFGGRNIIKGQTAELVARSKLVVMHLSTALSYAVLFKKPVIPVKIPGMSANGQMNLMVEAMGGAIGSKPIDLNKDELTASLLQRECNLEKYSEYASRYVKTIGADELPAWEIVVKAVKQIQPVICHEN